MDWFIVETITAKGFVSVTNNNQANMFGHDKVALHVNISQLIYEIHVDFKPDPPIKFTITDQTNASDFRGIQNTNHSPDMV